MKCKLADIAELNPKESLKKGTVAKKVAMDQLQPFCRDIPGYTLETFNGGTKFRNGDTIMARITPCLENGKTAKVNILDDGEIGFGSTEYIVFRAKKSISDEDYLYYLIRSPLVRGAAIKSMVGSSGRQRVQTDVVQNIEINLPPITEQKKIGALLRVFDDKIALNNKINDNLEQQAKLLYEEMFLNNPDADMVSGTLSDIATITMGQSPSGSSYNEDSVGEVFYQGRAEFGFRFPTRRLFTTEPKRMAEPGDVLLSVRAPVGDLNVAYEKCCIGRGLGAIHSKTGDSSFMLYTMFALKPHLDIFNGEGTVFGSINRDGLSNLPVNIPSAEEIAKFEAVVRPMDNLIRTNYEEICCLQSIRDSLLPKLMSGEIDVSNIQL